MRSVTLTGHNFQVTDDPQEALTDFLGLATCSTTMTSEQILRELETGGDGYAVQGLTGAYEIETVDDVPNVFFYDEDFAPPEGPDWWIVRAQRPGEGSRYLLLQGEELRHLFATASALWKQYESSRRK